MLVVSAVLLLGLGHGVTAARGGGLFALAAVGGVLATRRFGRRLVGVVTVLVGVLVVVTGGAWSVVTGGLLLVLAGAGTAWRATRWPSMSGRYDAGAAAASAAGVDPARRSHDLWDALDRGEDPTRQDEVPR
jgi:hypothetical protein